MVHEPEITSRFWDSRREESYFSQLEDRFSDELNFELDYPSVAVGYPARFAQMIKELPPGYRVDFLADLICSVNCLCLRSWRDYVKANWESSQPDSMLSILDKLPRLSDFLSSVGLEPSIVQRYPTLAKDELVARNAYADGGRSEDYLARYGCKIQSPDPSLIIVPEKIGRAHV